MTLPRRYGITATIRTETTDGYTGVRQVPTFYLDADVQGITSEDHARRIAEAIVNPFGTLTVHVSAVAL